MARAEKKGLSVREVREALLRKSREKRRTTERKEIRIAKDMQLVSFDRLMEMAR